MAEQHSPERSQAVGYLLNTYPVTSGTFIRREIEALERQGRSIHRYAVRRWDDQLVDPADIAEQNRTDYVLSGNAGGVAKAMLAELLTRPSAVFAALPAWRAIAKNTDGLARSVAYLAEAAWMRRQTANDGVGHLHCHFATNAAAVAMLCRLMGGPTYSFTAHGPDEFTDPEKWRYDLKVGHAAFAVAITHFARMQLIRWGGPQHRGKVHVGRCGLHLDDFEVTPPTGSKTFVCVGRLCPQKGQALIPDAVAPLIAEHPDLKIVLIGDGESRPEVEAEIARLGLEANFELTGWMANAEVRERLKQSRALLLPSFAEGLPIVIMEALALGRPAISTYIAGIPELLDEECGWIVPASSVDHLRAAISDALGADTARLAAMGREGRRRIEEHHNVDGLAKQLDGWFERTLATEPEAI